MATRRRRKTPRAGSLTVVGTGLLLGGHLTLESERAIRDAELVLHVTNGPLIERWLTRLNRSATSLVDLYQPGRPRYVTYGLMVDRICAEVEAGKRVCAVYYGHPGVLAQAPHAAIRRLRRAGYDARMLPGIAADACLFADLGVNPGDRGCATFEATDFLAYARRIDPTSELVLWQVGLLGEGSTRPGMTSRQDRVRVLVQRLRQWYPATHRVAVYLAATLPWDTFSVRWVTLGSLAKVRLKPMMTLYVPPLASRRPNRRVLAWLSA